VTGDSKCLALYCVDPKNNASCTTYYHAAADGTSCGVDSVCYKGHCVKEEEIEEVPEPSCNGNL